MVKQLLSRVTGGLLGRRSAGPDRVLSVSAEARAAWLEIPGAVACPGCGAIYVGEGCLDGDARAYEDEGWEAIDRLAAECPNHRDYFVVGI